MPEWLRGRTANPLGYALVGSNPIVCEVDSWPSGKAADCRSADRVFESRWVLYGDVDQLVDRSLCMREVGGSKPSISKSILLPDRSYLLVFRIYLNYLL